MQGRYASKANTPNLSFGPQTVSQQQAQRIVLSSLARKSIVTSEGMVSRSLGGKSVSSAAYKPFEA
jgi:hypothetical protein